jgi:hypothetical protein
MTAETTASGQGAASRHLVIVARDRPDLYGQLTDQFANDPNVTVLLDRRVEERRRQEVARMPERRRRDRRSSNVEILGKLWLAGYAVVPIQ